jgi:hypothetical protein
MPSDVGNGTSISTDTYQQTSNITIFILLMVDLAKQYLIILLSWIILLNNVSIQIKIHMHFCPIWY